MWTLDRKQWKPWTARLLSCVSLTVLGIVALTKNDPDALRLNTIAHTPPPSSRPIDSSDLPKSPRSPEANLMALPGILVSLDEVKVWGDLARWRGTPPAKRLTESLRRDEFTSSHPFDDIADLKPIKDILSLGIEDFERSLFRSPQFLAGNGYDTVRYKIKIKDGSWAYAFAYKKSPDTDRVTIDSAQDLRPTYALFIIPKANGQAETFLFENGRLKNNQVAAMTEALSTMEHWIEISTPYLAWN